MNVSDFNVTSGVGATSPLSAEVANKTALSRLVDDLVAVLDEGPVGFDPKVAMGLAIGTPLALLAMCVMCLICRGVPSTPCGGRCTYWKRMPREPRGLEPDGAIGEHQDELTETDSVDEEARVEQDPLEEDGLQDVELGEEASGNGQRECCSKMAAALEAGALVENADSAVVTNGSPIVSSVPSADTKKKRGTPNGKAKMVSIQAPDPMD